MTKVASGGLIRVAGFLSHVRGIAFLTDLAVSRPGRIQKSQFSRGSTAFVVYLNEGLTFAHFALSIEWRGVRGGLLPKRVNHLFGILSQESLNENSAPAHLRS
jgi:hypothetical protein